MKQQAILRSMVLCALIVCVCGGGRAQTLQTALTAAAAAFSQGKPVNTVTLNATAQWILGSDNESGNATLTANADGSFSVQLQLGQSSRAESQTSFSPGQTCNWSGADGVAHPAAPHNCMGSMAWFLPQVALFGNQQPSAVTTTLLASASQLLDIRQQRTPPAALSTDTAGLLGHLSSVDLYLDPKTYLPAALAFNSHPDQNAASDIPVQVVFTNYQSVNGAMVPFHIQRYVNGVLNLDLTVTQASAN
jgi:hypothetical protein